jgi:hypothetical protein
MLATAIVRLGCDWISAGLTEYAIRIATDFHPSLPTLTHALQTIRTARVRGTADFPDGSSLLSIFD